MFWLGVEEWRGRLNELESGENFWILVVHVGSVNILKISGYFGNSLFFFFPSLKRKPSQRFSLPQSTDANKNLLPPTLDPTHSSPAWELLGRERELSLLTEAPPWLHSGSEADGRPP